MKYLLFAILVSSVCNAQGIDATAWKNKSGSAYNDPRGYVAGFTNGSWLEYSVSLSAGDYVIAITYATTQTKTKFKIGTDTIALPNTGGWNILKTVSDTITLPAVSLLRINSVGTEVANFYNFSLSQINSPVIIPPPTTGITTDTIFCTEIAYPVARNVIYKTVKYLIVTRDKSEVWYAPSNVVDNSGARVDVLRFKLPNGHWVSF